MSSECEDCDEGRVWNNADPTSGQWVECEPCAQGIEAGTVETERLDAKHESPVVEDHAPEGSMP